MIKNDIEQMKRCCKNCKNYNGNFCKTFTAVKQPDPNTFSCSYFTRTTPLVVTGISLGIKCIKAICDKTTDIINECTKKYEQEHVKDYTVKPEDIKEEK